jgi:hypothetical protein
MAEAKVVKPETEYITIPEETVLGDKHPEVAINWDKYEPGKTYEVSPDVAAEIRKILKSRAEYDLRILRGQCDKKTTGQYLKSRGVTVVGGNDFASQLENM